MYIFVCAINVWITVIAHKFISICIKKRFLCFVIYLLYLVRRTSRTRVFLAALYSCRSAYKFTAILPQRKLKTICSTAQPLRVIQRAHIVNTLINQLF